jgi:pyruvoyl-dependent arginine decarboxylase (PvlArgDC)
MTTPAETCSHGCGSTDLLGAGMCLPCLLAWAEAKSDETTRAAAARAAALPRDDVHTARLEELRDDEPDGLDLASEALRGE